MSVRARKSVILLAATAAAFVPAATGAASPSARTVLALELNERAGVTVARDSSGLGHHGTIGSHVVMRGGYADWDRHPPTGGVSYGRAHLIVVPDAADASLDPGAGDFTLEFRFRTKEKFGNIMQKGQSKTTGGQVKIQAPKGKVSCMFKTPQGTATAGSGATPLNDNQWHTVE